MQTKNAQPPEKPWYRQFWPWFIMALPATAVVAGISLVVIAVRNQDSVVRDDWYKEGRAINQNMARDEAAGRLHIVAEVKMDAVTGEVDVTLQASPMPENAVAGNAAPGNAQPGNWPAQLQLQLSHPTKAEEDQHLVLLKKADGHYHGQLQQALHGRFDVELGNDEWRLLSRQTFPLGRFTLRHE